jgi:hypothetical protein
MLREPILRVCSAGGHRESAANRPCAQNNERPRWYFHS